MANIFVNRQSVGRLSRAEPVNQFTYDIGVSPAQAVSLLMPVGAGVHVAEKPGALHPVFDMSLPEGALREAVSQLFAKALPVLDDLALFQIVGRSLIGRLRCGETPADLDEVPAHDLRDLLKSRGTGDLFADLLTRYALYSGVSGVQPKVLVRDNGSLRTNTFSPVNPGERLTAHGTTHIVKSFDPVKFPGLAANEFFCLRAARSAGLDVAQAELAQDGGLLVITRFDLKPNGSYLAFEDGCALSGRLSREKYEGSYEQLAATLAQVLRSPDGATAELARFFRSLVFSIVVRNGDAHRKNFGVLYDDTGGDVTLAPAFDIITTTPYIPQDSMALTLDGTKRWPDAKRLEKFGVQRCRLSASAAKTIMAEVAEAVAQTSRDFSTIDDLDPRSGDLSQKMQFAWTEGVASIAHRP